MANRFYNKAVTAGCKASNPFDTGVIYAPYVPFSSTGSVAFPDIDHTAIARKRYETIEKGVRWFTYLKWADIILIAMYIKTWSGLWTLAPIILTGLSLWFVWSNIKTMRGQMDDVVIEML